MTRWADGTAGFDGPAKYLLRLCPDPYLPPEIAQGAHEGRCDGELLRLLAEADGLTGTCVVDAMVYGLGARDRADRAFAGDALLIMAARGGFDWAELGRRIAGNELPSTGRIVFHDQAAASAAGIGARRPHELPAKLTSGSAGAQKLDQWRQKVDRKGRWCSEG